MRWCSPAGSKAIAPAAASLGRLADEHGPGRGRGLEPRGGVDEVAGDHALVRRPERDGGLAGQDARTRLQPWVDGPDRIDELETGADAPLGVVLVGDRGAPDRHHGVADELLDRAAVALDDVARDARSTG